MSAAQVQNRIIAAQPTGGAYVQPFANLVPRNCRIAACSPPNTTWGRAMVKATLPKLTVFGHRGARGCAPENTLLALDTGIKLGADWVEFDVQRHPDGSLLLLHDQTVNRTTNGHGWLQDMPFEQLRALDAGCGQQIPTLEEALDLVDQRAGINIELKQGAGIAGAVARVLRNYLNLGWPPDRMLVSSFHLPELWEFKQSAPEIPVAPLLGGVPLDWAGCAAELEAVAVHLSAEYLDPRLIADAHERGCRVHVYTINDRDMMQALQSIGVDGLFTDYPDRACRLSPDS